MLVLLLVLAAVALAARRFLLERSGGTVECALRHPAETGGWRLGLLSFHRDEVHWHRALGVLLRPEMVFHRRGLSVVGRRPARPDEEAALGADRVVVEVATKPAADASGSPSGEHVELAMTDQALTGFLAWLEASPPGSHLADFGLPPGTAPGAGVVCPASSAPPARGAGALSGRRPAATGRRPSPR